MGNNPLSYAETVALFRWNCLNFHPFDQCPTRPAVDRALELQHALLFPFRDRLHAAIRKVPDISGEVFGACLVVGEEPEADALHAP